MKHTILLLGAGLAASVVAFAQPDYSSVDFKCSKLDEQGVLWLGTEGSGLWRIDGTSAEPYSADGAAVADNIYDLTLDPQGHLWLATDNGIMTYDYLSWNLLPMKPPYVAVSKMGVPAITTERKVVGLSINHQKHAWLAVMDEETGKRLLMRFNGETFVDLIKPFEVHDIFEDLDANLWMNDGAYKVENGMLKLSVKLPSGMITSAVHDVFGNVWIASDEYGLYRYDGKELRFFGADYGLESTRVKCIHSDKSGRVWLGTESTIDHSQGIGYFEMGAFHLLENSEACTVNSVNTIASDKKGRVWFAGENGALILFNGRSYKTIDVMQALSK